MNNGSEFDPRLPAVLSARNLAVLRGERCICRGINFTVQAGETLEITGANGSGKTSLLRVFAGLSGGYTGNLAWRRCVWRNLQGRQFEETSYIAHRTGFKDALSVQENLRFYATIKPAATEKDTVDRTDDLDGKIKNALTRLGIGGFGNKLFASLSEGQRRRVVLARLLVETTTLWLLDEPTAALDQEGAAIFEELLASHASYGGVAVVATHRRLERTSKLKHLKLASVEGF